VPTRQQQRPRVIRPARKRSRPRRWRSTSARLRRGCTGAVVTSSAWNSLAVLRSSIVGRLCPTTSTWLGPPGRCAIRITTCPERWRGMTHLRRARSIRSVTNLLIRNSPPRGSRGLFFRHVDEHGKFECAADGKDDSACAALRNTTGWRPTAFDERRRTSAGGQLGKGWRWFRSHAQCCWQQACWRSRSPALWRNTTLLEKKANPPILVPPLETTKRFLLKAPRRAIRAPTTLMVSHLEMRPLGGSQGRNRPRKTPNST
jgi:hypothetical protein